MAKTTLCDTFPTTFEPILTEGENSPKKWRGKFAKAGEPTKNGRVYSRKLWENIVKSENVQSRLSGGMVGVINHPSDGETDLFRSAISTFKLDIDADDYVVGEAVILPTPGGALLEGLLRSGTKVGVSSRGRGTVDDNGNVNEDYVLVAFDVVDNPAVPDAIPAVSESTKVNNDNTHRRKPMSGAYETLLRIESSIDATLFLIESGEFTQETVNPLSQLLEGTLKELGGLLSEDDKNSLVSPLVVNLYNRITEARSILKRGPKPKATKDKTTGDATVAEGDVPHVDLASLKKPDGAKTTSEDDSTAANSDTTGGDTKLSEMEHDSLVAYCEELEEANKSLEKKYQDSVWALEEFKNRSAKSDVDEAVEKAVKDNPFLDEYKDLLGESSSIEEVNKLVERFIKLASTNKPDENTQKPKPNSEPLPGSKTSVTEDTNVVENVDSEGTDGDSVLDYADFFVALDESTKPKDN